MLSTTAHQSETGIRTIVECGHAIDKPAIRCNIGWTVYGLYRLVAGSEIQADKCPGIKHPEAEIIAIEVRCCLLYTSDAADEHRDV